MQILSHPDAQAFLTKIRAEDADDTNRLVFADWLEERGEPHLEAWAHFIRAQVTMAVIWPYPEPPKTLDLVQQDRRREYWLLEQQEKELLEKFQPEWLVYNTEGGKKHLSPGNPNKVKWRRGFMGLNLHDMKELRKYQSRSSWPLVTSLVLQSVRSVRTRTSNDQSALLNVIRSDQLNEIVFGPGRAADVRDWLGVLITEVPNLRRIGFEMYDLLEPWMTGLTRPTFYRTNKQAKLVLKPLNTFSTAAINNLKQVFGDRVAVDSSKCHGGARGARMW